MRTIWIISILVMACSAEAGPWLRPDGEGFMSVDSIGSIGRDQGDLKAYSGLFVEYGVQKDTTLGILGGIDETNDRNATAFVRRAIPSAWNNWVMAYELGLGARFLAYETKPHLRVGLSVGRGSLFQDDTGWFNLDTSFDLSRNDTPAIKIEATLGKRGKKGWLYMLQPLAERTESNGWTFGISPSLAIPLNENRHLQIGFTASSQDEGRFGLKAALWRKF